MTYRSFGSADFHPSDVTCSCKVLWRAKCKTILTLTFLQFCVMHV